VDKIRKPKKPQDLVRPPHCPLSIIQLNKSETTDSILILFPKKNQPPKCPLERKSSNPASKMSITPLFTKVGKKIMG
jgi:hypothetical protein